MRHKIKYICLNLKHGCENYDHERNVVNFLDLPSALFLLRARVLCFLWRLERLVASRI